MKRRIMSSFHMCVIHLKLACVDLFMNRTCTVLICVFDFTMNVEHKNQNLFKHEQVGLYLAYETHEICKSVYIAYLFCICSKYVFCVLQWPSLQLIKNSFPPQVLQDPVVLARRAKILGEFSPTIT